jgi:hypothetical protein
MWRRSLLRWLAPVAVVIAVAALRASAQEREWSVAAGVALGYDRPRGDVIQGKWSPFAGVSIGLERHLATAFSVRGSATLAAPGNKGDDVSICYPAPPGSQTPCLPRPSYASEYALYSVAGLIQPSQHVPIELLAGAGWASFQKAGGPPPLPNSRAFWQWGASFLLGHSHRAPRLDVSEIRFAEPVGRVRRLVGLALWLRY